MYLSRRCTRNRDYDRCVLQLLTQISFHWAPHCYSLDLFEAAFEFWVARLGVSQVYYLMIGQLRLDAVYHVPVQIQASSSSSSSSLEIWSGMDEMNRAAIRGFAMHGSDGIVKHYNCHRQVPRMPQHTHTHTYIYIEREGMLS